MNDILNCKLYNIIYDTNNKIYLLNKYVNQYVNYKMVIVPKFHIKKKIFIQFKIHTQSIKLIDFIFGGKVKKYTNIHPDGFLISFNFEPNNINNKFEIQFYPFVKDYNIIDHVKIKINKIIIYKYELSNFIKINWNKIFIINLNRREDRKKKMIYMFEKLKINSNNFEFIEAIDGLDKNILLKYNELKNKSLTKIVSSGHFACLLSHIKAIEIAKQRNYSSIMILEDDVILCENFISKLENLLVPIYDMIYLGGIINKKKVLFNDWVKYNKIMGAYGYILKANLFDIVLKELNKLTDYVDLFYLKQIQTNYNIILLDDFVKTNLDSSDTSDKNYLMVQRLFYIK